MEVPIPPQYEKLVREKVDKGWYRTTGDVIEHALQLLEEQDAVDQIRLNRLRNDVQEGLDQLDEGLAVDGREMFKRLRDMNTSPE